MINKLIIIQTKNELQNIKNRYQVKYGAAVFDIKIKIINNNIVLEGVVLTERQKKETFLAVQRISKDIKVKNEIKVLAEPKEKLEIGWGIIENSIIDVWGIFPIKKELIEKVRATQAVRGDIVRLLDIEGRYVLVQTQDLAIGWIKGSQILKVESLKLVKKWRNKKRIKINKKINIKLTNNLRNKVISFLENYVYAPYVWGGTTELGIDCSGLVQKFYSEIFGILLPRHSAEQAGYGEKVNMEKSRFGDLVFLREKTKKYPHIGIIIEVNKKPIRWLADKNQKLKNILVLNARRERGGVVIESAEEILKNYKLISVKRLININN